MEFQHKLESKLSFPRYIKLEHEVGALVVFCQTERHLFLIV